LRTGSSITSPGRGRAGSLYMVTASGVRSTVQPGVRAAVRSAAIRNALTFSVWS
jgi:hypothetical protein